jgi:RNA-directed DNA polymerase
LGGREGEAIDVSLATPEKLRELQSKLNRKAKDEPEYRFYQLYDKIYRSDILEHAWRLVKANDGAPGVDRESIEEIEKEGVEEWLKGIGKELHDRTYEACPVRRKMIEKQGGGERPLGIPTVKDRVVQTAAKLILEPIFEADLEPNAYGYRPGKSAQGAITEVLEVMREGYTDIVDADLSKYFDTIPHSELMKCAAKRIVDKHMLHLIQMWLKVEVEERDERTGKTRVSGGKDNDRGTPQGGVISPLLANLYMNRMLKGWRRTGRGQQYRAKLVNYADDFVILSKGRAKEALEWTRGVLERLGLVLNEKKTSIRDARTEHFQFLGYTFGMYYSPRNGQEYLGCRPSKKSVQRIKERVQDLLKESRVDRWEEVCKRLNQTLIGWRAYYYLGSPGKAYRAVDGYVEESVRRFLRRRHKVSTQGTRRFGREQVYGPLGVYRLQGPLRAVSS